MLTINKMIQDLISSGGMTQKEIADAVGVSQPVISDLYREIQKDVGYERAGKKIAALHEEKIVKKAA